MTAVEFLEKELKKGVHNNDVSFYDLIDKAKEMEKQQIIDAIECPNFWEKYKSAEDYYNEIYKK